MPKGSGVRAVLALFVVLVPAACGPAASSPVQGTPVPTPSLSAPSPSVEPTTASVAPTSALEGTWETGVIAQSDVEATLEQQGLGGWIEKFRPQSPIDAGMKLVLVIDRGNWDLYGESANGRRVQIDYHADYVIDGDVVEVIHAEGSNRHGWSVDGATLTFDHVRSTIPASAGIPDEVYQVALYMTESFVRQAA